MLLEIVMWVMSFLAPLPSGAGWQKDNVVVVAFSTEPYKVCETLHGVKTPSSVVGCVDEIGGRRIVLPNPCLFKDEHYARVACHELAHTHGWRHDFR